MVQELVSLGTNRLKKCSSGQFCAPVLDQSHTRVGGSSTFGFIYLPVAIDPPNPTGFYLAWQVIPLKNSADPLRRSSEDHLVIFLDQGTLNEIRVLDHDI